MTIKKVFIFLFLLNVFIFETFAETADICMSKTNVLPNSKIKDLENRVKVLEQQVTPPVGPCAKSGYGVYLFCDPLYLRTEEDGLEYAITGSFNLGFLPGGGYKLDISKGETHAPDFDWEFGFRLGLGYFLPYDGWDISSNYMRLHEKTSDSIRRNGNPNVNYLLLTGGSGDFISPFWVAQLFANPGFVNYAKATWRLKIDMIDLNLGREFFIARHLSIKPHVGLRNGWVDQNYNLNFIAYNYPTSATQIKRNIKVKMQNDFWGIGYNLGANTRWFLGKGISLFGNGAFSLLEGIFNIKYDLHDHQPIAAFEVVGTGPGGLATNVILPFDDTYVATKRIHSFMPVLDLAMGLRWDKAFSNDKFCLALKLGYEYSIFFGQNRFMNHQYDFTLITMAPQENNGPNYFTDRGNLTLSGVSASVNFTF